MRAVVDQDRSQALADCAEEVFEALVPEDLAALLAGFCSREELRDRVVDLAGRMLDKLARTKTVDPVLPSEYRLVVAACFSWGRSQAGVAKNLGHAVRKFRRYRGFPVLPLEILVRTDRKVPDDERVVDLLARSLRIRAGLREAGGDREPELILNMVVPAIVAALEPGSDHASGPVADAVLVDIALGVLDRGAELAAAYRVAKRGAPVAGSGLPVAGNADFVVRIAAYRLAVEEHRGLVLNESLDELERAVVGLSAVLRESMIRSVARPGRRGPDEPDVASAFDRYAGYLGSVRGDKDIRAAVTAVHSVLTYRLGLGDPPGELVVEDPGSWVDVSPAGREPLSRLSEVEHLVGWLIAALFRGAGADAREPLLEWLDGARRPDTTRDLPLLLRRLRLATRVLDDAPESRPPRPAGISPARFEELVVRIAAAIDPGGLNGEARHNARYVALSAIPPLWTERRPAARLVARHLLHLIESRPSGAVQAVLVAAHGARAPQQFVEKSSRLQPGPCCQESAGGCFAVAGRPREPLPEKKICPYRPWGETGLVENYHTLGKLAGCGADATRTHLKRYEGPWSELLWP